MCGIAGIISSDRDGVEPALLRRMGDSLAHRGPDDRGYLCWSGEGPLSVARDSGELRPGRVGLAHRRLSILDLSDAGRQPMLTPDGRFALAFNGEIYNYLELRDELSSAGAEFRSHGDTEVLLHALARWGLEALGWLVGMFAVAWLDTQSRSVLLARDFFGIKPLYYTRVDEGLAFASEIRTLLQLPGVRAQVNPQRLYQYLRFGLTDHGDQTLFAGIQQVPPGHLARVSLDAPADVRPEPYWTLTPHPRDDLSFDQAAERLGELFLDSVRLHLRSDVPVGACLSGGIDSSAIVAGMRRVGGGGLDLRTFTYVAGDAGVDESRWAAMLNEHVAGVAHQTHPTADELVADLDELLDTQEEPFGSTSIYAQCRVLRLAREAGLKVMLDGQGADELLGGYRPYVAARVASLLRQGRCLAAERLLHRAAARPGVRKLTLRLRAMGLLLPGPLQGAARRLVGEDLTPDWLDETWFARYGVRAAPLWRAGGRDVLRRHLVESVAAKSLPMLLRYEDRNSMACSIESRVPFLTPAIAEFVLSLPEEYLIAPDGTSKAVFRRAMRGLVPDAILDRRDKIGFATPERGWLAAVAPWAEATLAGDAARRIPAIRHDVIARQWADVQAGRRPFDTTVWRWLNLIRWAERFNVAFEQ